MQITKDISIQMHPYLPHLLEDIRMGHREERLKQTEVIERPDIIAALNPINKSLGYYAGLNLEEFPPAAQLKNPDLKLVITALRTMMKTWGVGCSFPQNLPPRNRYSLMIEMLDRPICPDAGFTIILSFCMMDPEKCRLEKYCTCRKAL